MRRLIHCAVFAWLAWAPTVTAADDPLLAAAIIESEAASEPPRLSRERFNREPVISFSTLSPNGNWLAFAEREDSQLNLHILHTDSLKIEALFNTNRLRSLSWSEDSRRLILGLDNAIGFIDVADAARPSYMMSLDRNRGDTMLRPGFSPIGTVLAVVKEDQAYVLKQAHLDGTVETIFSSPGLIRDALATADKDHWFLKIIHADSQSIYELKGGVLTEIVHCTVVDVCTLGSFDQHSSTLWLRSSVGEDLAALYSWSVQDRSLQRQHADPAGLVDIQRVIYLEREPKIAQYHDAILSSYGLDEEVQAQVQALYSHFDNANLDIELSTGKYWFIREASSVLRDDNYYLYAPENKQLTRVLGDFASREPLDAEALSRKIPFSYAASDGLQLHAYLHLPKGTDLSAAPLVTLVHGGPWGRIDSSYDALSQGLVNQGYIVFLPNFRASKGYGKHYMMSANKDFGNGVVQRDIEEGVEYLLSQGIGDPGRLAIVGSSFGGFSVLTALAFSPEKFRAGIAMAPPADMENVSRYVESLVGFGSNPIERESHRLLMVDFDEPQELATLYAKSPYANLDKISAPLLVIAGGDDDRVGIAHVKDYTLRLLNSGKPITAVLDDDEGHRFTDEESRAATRYLTQEFLSLNLDGPLVESPTPRVKSYLRRNVRFNTNNNFLEILE